MVWCSSTRVGNGRGPTPLEVKEGGVTSVAFGPEGRLAAGYKRDEGGGGVVLFDARGERSRPAPLEVKEGGVTSVAFGPEGRLAAGYDREGNVGGVVLFDARGERFGPAPLEVKEGGVYSVAFGPEGRLAAGYHSHAALTAGWFSSTLIRTGGGGRRAGGQPQPDAGGVETILPREPLPPYDPIPALAA